MSAFRPVPYSEKHARRMQSYRAQGWSATTAWFSADADLHAPQARQDSLADSDLLKVSHRQFVSDLPDAGLEPRQEFHQLAIVFGRHLAPEDGRLVLEHDGNRRERLNPLVAAKHVGDCSRRIARVSQGIKLPFERRRSDGGRGLDD